MNRILIWTTIISVVVCIGIKEYWDYKTFDLDGHLVSYGMTRTNIHQKRLDYEQDWKKNPAKKTVLQNMAKSYLYNILTDSVFYYWYGTTWDFNGITEKPRKGKIACGYFVTTTLAHCGFFLPRVKMAQQAASIIIRSLCRQESIRTVNKLSLLKGYMDKQEKGIYILGLDTHVGYLWKSEEGLYFVHASYSGNKQVSKEKWDESRVLSKSKLFMVGDMLGNPLLIKDWIEGASIVLDS
jgi:hypothetical protein